jgi:hypothetical protein
MKKQLFTSIVCFLAASFSSTVLAAEFHVALQGKDGNSGGAAAPFATVARAQWAVREMKQAGKPAGPVNVYVHGGVYRMAEPLAFGPEDSGTVDAPIVYQSAPSAPCSVAAASSPDGTNTMTGSGRPNFRK